MKLKGTAEVCVSYLQVAKWFTVNLKLLIDADKLRTEVSPHYWGGDPFSTPLQLDSAFTGNDMLVNSWAREETTWPYHITVCVAETRVVPLSSKRLHTHPTTTPVPCGISFCDFFFFSPSRRRTPRHIKWKALELLYVLILQNGRRHAVFKRFWALQEEGGRETGELCAFVCL